MKKYIFLFAVIVTLTYGCDYVTIPQQAGGSVVIPTSDTIRRVLIEDFTGHLCINCPDAARMIDSLEQAFPGRVIGMGVHNDYFAEPCPPHPYPAGGPFPTGAWAEDFRALPEDASYNTIFNSNSFPLPAGLVNRYQFFPAGNPIQYADWPSTVATILAQPMTAYIKLTPTYNSSSRSLTVQVAGEFMCDTAGTYMISLFLVEDGLTGYQLDDNIVPSGISSNYNFHHVMRACINTPGSVQGDTVITGTLIANHTGISYTSPAYIIPAGFNAANCKVIGMLFKSTDYGVLQAAEVSVQ